MDLRLLTPRTTLRFSLLALGICLVGGVWYFNLAQHVTLDNAKELEANLGLWGPCVFVAVFVVGELLQIPSVLWIFIASLIWPWWFALPLSLFAACIAAIVAFLVARYFLGHGFHKKLPSDLKRLNERLISAPIRTVILIRLVTFLSPILHWVLAASSVRIGPFTMGTAIGLIPGTIAIVLFGEVFVLWWEQYAPFLVGAIVVGISVYVYISKRQAVTED